MFWENFQTIQSEMKAFFDMKLDKLDEKFNKC